MVICKCYGILYNGADHPLMCGSEGVLEAVSHGLGGLTSSIHVDLESLLKLETGKGTG